MLDFNSVSSISPRVALEGTGPVLVSNATAWDSMKTHVTASLLHDKPLPAVLIHGLHLK